MKAIVSSTYSDNYLWNLPLVTYLWNKLGVEAICFMRLPKTDLEKQKVDLILKLKIENNLKIEFYPFEAPTHKEATYAQVSRLYAACLDLPEDEVLITSDVDMGVFKLPPYESMFTIWGHDLAPKGQYPICYASGMVKEWRAAFNLNGISYQQALDRLLGEDECEHYRGNRWAVDQEQLAKGLKNINHTVVPRSNGENQFAQNRVDRDDTYYKDRLDRYNLIDVHFWRPGYTSDNFAEILELMKFMFPSEGFDWLVEYNEQYKKLL